MHKVGNGIDKNLVAYYFNGCKFPDFQLNYQYPLYIKTIKVNGFSILKRTVMNI